MKFYPYEKGGGGHKMFGVVFYAVAWSFSHIEGGGAWKLYNLWKGGGGRKKFYPVLRLGGGVQQVSDPRFTHFVAPSPHN